MALLAYLQSKNTSLSKEILDNLYVENILLSASTPAEAIRKYRESKALLAEIGMNLREYISNSEEVNDAIPEKDRAPSGIMKLLGVKYDPRTDFFHLSMNFPKSRRSQKET